MYCAKYTLSLTTDGAGAATGYLGACNGPLLELRYVADGSTPYDNTVDFTVTNETSGEAILSVSNVAASTIYNPVRGAKDTSGAAIAGQYDSLYLSNERIKIVLAQGGATKVGQFVAIIGGAFGA